MTVLCALSVLLLAAGAPPSARATFPGRNGALLVFGDTADYSDNCTEARRPRPVGRVADSDGPICDPTASPPADALFLYGPWPQGLRQFAPGASHAAFSPSGRRVAVVADDALRLIDVAVGGRGRFIRKNVTDVAWTPSGRLVAMRGSELSDRVLLDLSLSGRGRILRRGGEPDVSVTGRIAYIDSHRRLSIMRADGSHPRRVLRGERSIEMSPSWSPDGRRLAFVRLDPGGTEKDAIWIVRSDGEGLRRITSYGVSGFEAPTWAPDGRTIAFGLAPQGSLQVGDVRGVSPSASRPLGRSAWRRLFRYAELTDWQPLP